MFPDGELLNYIEFGIIRLSQGEQYSENTEDNEVVYTFDRHEWKWIAKHSYQSRILDAFENEGVFGIERIMGEYWNSEGYFDDYRNDPLGLTDRELSVV